VILLRSFDSISHALMEVFSRARQETVVENLSVSRVDMLCYVELKCQPGSMRNNSSGRERTKDRNRMGHSCQQALTSKFGPDFG